jgi:hypothetical protein
MKIAVCFIGMIRAGVESAENLKHWFRYLYDDIDFFMHTWDISESKPWHRDSLPALNKTQTQNLYKMSSYHLVEQLNGMYDNKFVSIEIENQNKFLALPFFINLHHFSPQWYSWYKVLQLVENYEKINNFQYDIVVKIRPDIIFPTERNLNEEVLRFNGDPTALYTLGYNPIRIDDVMFLGSSETMKKASKFIIQVEKNIWEANILGEWLEKIGITALNTAHTVYCIYRKEHVELGISPNEFVQCLNIEHKFHAPYNLNGL